MFYRTGVFLSSDDDYVPSHTESEDSEEEDILQDDLKPRKKQTLESPGIFETRIFERGMCITYKTMEHPT